MPPRRIRAQKPTNREIRGGRGFHGFRHQEEESWFEQYFITRRVVIERPIGQHEYPLPFYFRVIHERGWFSALHTTRPCNMNMVREFCASLMGNAGYPFIFDAYVRGREVVLTPSQIANMLGIEPMVEFDCPFRADAEEPSLAVVSAELTGNANTVWNLDKIRIAKLTREYRMLFLLVVNCILPTTYRQKIDWETARIIYALGTGLRVSLPHVLIECIAYPCATSAQTKALKLGGLITELCTSAGVPQRMTDEIKWPRGHFDARAERRSRAQARRPASDGEESEDSDEESEGGDEQEGADEEEEGREEEEVGAAEEVFEEGRAVSPDVEHEQQSKWNEDRDRPYLTSVHEYLEQILEGQRQMLQGQQATQETMTRFGQQMSDIQQQQADIQSRLARLETSSSRSQAPSRRRNT